MWLRLFMLALCGMPALRADVCDGLPASPPKQSGSSESNEPLSFKLSVKSGGPAFRITVRPLWQIKAGREIIDETRAGEIEVARCKDGKQLQVLPIAADQPISFSYSFQAEDLNFDGYLDFSVETEFSGTGGEIRSYWVYDPRSGIFIQNEFTHELRCGSAAVTSKRYTPRRRRNTRYSLGDRRNLLGRSLHRLRPGEARDQQEILRRRYGGLSKYGRRKRRTLPRREQSPDPHSHTGV